MQRYIEELCDLVDVTSPVFSACQLLLVIQVFVLCPLLVVCMWHQVNARNSPLFLDSAEQDCSTGDISVSIHLMHKVTLISQNTCFQCFRRRKMVSRNSSNSKFAKNYFVSSLLVLKVNISTRVSLTVWTGWVQLCQLARCRQSSDGDQLVSTTTASGQDWSEPRRLGMWSVTKKIQKTKFAKPHE